MKRKHRAHAASLVAVLLLFTNPAFADTEANIQVARQMIDTINARRFDDLARFMHEDVKRHSGATPGVTVSSLAEFRAYLEADLEAVPDSVQTIEAIFGSGDMVALRARYHGTQSGPFGPFPPTGKSFELPFIGILRFNEGKVAEIWIEWDNLNALMQLGLLEPPQPDQ